MNDKNTQQRNDKKHRKLVRSPEKLSPCDFDPFFNPSLLSASANVLINQFQTTTTTTAATNQKNRSSPTKNYNDQFPPPQQQLFWLSNESPQQISNTSLPPSSSTPSIALHRKPSITIRTISKDDDIITPPTLEQHHHHHHHQSISKSIDLTHPFTTSSTISSEMKDQMSNNFLINFPRCYDVSSSQSLNKNQQHQVIDKNLSPFNYNDEFTTNSSNVYNNQSSPVSQSSLNLNLLANQQQQQQQVTSNSGHIVFSSNNPFLNDNFDSIMTDTSGDCGHNFFNIDDSNDSEVLVLTSDEVVTTTTRTKLLNDDDDLNQEDEQSLKNKREKFSTASPTMKICLVVSPPTNKTFQVSNLMCSTKA